MNILSIKYWALRLANSAIQRALANPITTFGVGSIGGTVAVVVAAFSAQGCHLSAINYAEIFTAVQVGGAALTDANKALVHHTDGKVSTVPVEPTIPTGADFSRPGGSN